MAQIKVEKLTFAYDGQCENVFTEVTLQLDTAWRLGLIAPNGRGKTTFLKLLLNEYAYQGTISSPTEFVYFPFAVSAPERTAWAIAKELHPAVQKWELIRELALLKVSAVDLERPFAVLSPGTRIKVLLAVLFLRENAFLLLDEPTDHLDEQGRAAIAAYLRRKNGFIVVSHDRNFLDSCIDHVLAINKSNITVEQGNFSTWQENKERRDNFELQSNERLQKEIGRLQKTAREKAVWAQQAEREKIGIDPLAVDVKKGYRAKQAAKAKKAMKRSKAIERRQEEAIRQKQALLHDVEKCEELKLHPLASKGDMLLELQNVTLSYGPQVVLRDFSLRVAPGERIALSGRNGAGKSTLLKYLNSELAAACGEMRTAPHFRISYLPQECELPAVSLREWVSKCSADTSLFLTILRKLGFSREEFAYDLSAFSAGQKKKVLLARSLCESAHIYLWDEPLNYLDVFARLQLEELLLRYSPTIIFVEHDRAFIERVATREIIL